MRYLISLPESTVACFHTLSNQKPSDWFCASDPKPGRVGSGGGTAWLLSEAWRASNSPLRFTEWLESEGRLLIHGGGQSRRLPAYAAMGKLMLPMPILRWERGQRLNQTLLDLQRPLLERILAAAPVANATLVASGDVLVLAPQGIGELPSADVVCLGLPADAALAARHGVFVCPRSAPQTLEYVLQKPSTETLRRLAAEHLFYLDVGLWLLSARAVEWVMKKSGFDLERQVYAGPGPTFYDLYSQFGQALGAQPTLPDPELSELSVAVVPIPKGEFYHLGTSRELLSSCVALQNRVLDQREIWTRNIKPHPSMFVQNSLVRCRLRDTQSNLWIENSEVGAQWQLSSEHVVTGVPPNDWRVRLPPGVCLDVVPVDAERFALRPYGIDDRFSGPLQQPETRWLNTSFAQWLRERKLDILALGLDPGADIQQAPLFPVMSLDQPVERMLRFLLEAGDTYELYLETPRFSANQLSERANLARVEAQRTQYRRANWQQLAENHALSVFFQVDLAHAASEFAEHDIPLPAPIASQIAPLQHTHDRMFRARVKRHTNEEFEAERAEAFAILQRSLLQPVFADPLSPALNTYEDQIVWARSPVRIDLAGGWTDTPPYCVLEGGQVVNIALELNGLPPLQAFVRPTTNRSIALSSIDLGQREEVRSFDDLRGYKKVGSAFSIPKAALSLAGFLPEFSRKKYASLEQQLEDFGSGLEISFLAAVPKGSGLGTSSILAATLLGALSDSCGLGWDSAKICNRTLVLEQLLTTGGGWQDQYGGVLPGVKLLETSRGWEQTPRVRWLPDKLFRDPEYEKSMLLYYTGITRVAKHLLTEIVEGMFLNERERLSVLKEMKQHAIDTFDSIQQCDYTAFGRKIARSWKLNCRLDAGTTTPKLQQMIAPIDDLALGYKLPGAGGGGYLFIVAKDPEAARRIKRQLEASPPNARARFVEMSLSDRGLQVSRS